MNNRKETKSGKGYRVPSLPHPSMKKGNYQMQFIKFNVYDDNDNLIGVLEVVDEYYFEPTEDNLLSADELRKIADHLDEVNNKRK